ncbi:alanine--tRNA ligase [Companilactobacillus sp. RD055328]|uniref:alanine--tRNA ligase n=1 Tax=Companilactobacillus sp. RD055328 TaxID=2916634 RepID=UPI001FC835C9|nr:alanine--tRNA ligase [Companilactobacillus sp. RD055328]GKQ42101.1 alanine--tRNA ligase [Companilactobacillus sp. RD055328]
MKKLTGAQIRQLFLDFFESKGHTIEPSASLVPVNDPTLLWINSGVATLKKYFDGSVVPKNPRITNAQKCIRTNDIENVGKTARHQTFFEMLGNFSVGDYFKEDAIAWAWEFLTSDQWIGLDKDKMYVTVYPKDTEAQRIWKEIIPEDHIFQVEDNFWDIGEGPCGPDTELFYDRGQEFNNVAEDDEENYPGGENERYLEVWNVVFSEFNHMPDGTYVEQPHKNIDTGMGLERLVSVVQETKTNFETDLMMPLITKAEELSDGKKYGADNKDDISFKIIADHARTVSFAIGDGALPSNEGRGYVIRRLIRRAVLNGKKLGIDGSFMYQLVPIVGEIMKSYYPEITNQKDFIAKVIKSEEERFSNTLSDGLDLLNGLLTDLRANNKTEISGKDAFKLFDTYGFPYEMTEESANDEGFTVDRSGFDEEMEAQKTRARSARGNLQSMGSQDEVLMDIKTESEFVGYHDNYEVKDANLKDIIVNDAIVDSISEGIAQIIFDRTPFYAEMGGQVADQGFIYNGDEIVAKVTDVQHAPNGQNLHTVEVMGELKKDSIYQLKIDINFRRKVRRNHTATHLLDQALREVVGEHTHQAGSLVEPDYLRFDFTSLDAVTKEQLAELEQIVNEKIWEELPVVTTETDIDSAKKMGAIALFGDKYGDMVRVVQVGDYSMELCGGTHAENTAELGLFKIKSESGVAAGTRRIEAVTSKEAFEFLNEQMSLLLQTADAMKVTQIKETPTKASQVMADLKEEKRNVTNLKAKFASQQAAGIFDEVEEINGYTLIAKLAPVDDMNGLRKLADDWKNKHASDVLVLGAKSDDKANLIVAVSPDAMERGLKAGNIIKEISPAINGGGGGRPDMAQAGGKNPEGFEQAFIGVKNILTK